MKILFCWKLLVAVKSKKRPTNCIFNDKLMNLGRVKLGARNSRNDKEFCLSNEIFSVSIINSHFFINNGKWKFTKYKRPFVKANY